MTMYVVDVAREGDWWVFTAEGVGATQARTLEGAENVVADMLNEMYLAGALSVEGEIEVTIDFTDEQAAAYYQANAHRLDQIFDTEHPVEFTVMPKP